MMCMSSDEILARRREQNRLAQRRFREGRQSQRKGPKSSQCRKRVDSAQRSAESYQSSSSSPEPSPDDGMIDLLLENFQASALSTEVTPKFWSHQIASESLSDAMFPFSDSIDESTSAEILSLLSPYPKVSHILQTMSDTLKHKISPDNTFRSLLWILLCFHQRCQSYLNHCNVILHSGLLLRISILKTFSTTLGRFAKPSLSVHFISLLEMVTQILCKL
ncbi:hypothetical protein VTO58DRAFT_101309 [Aureobasidium pullulans]